MIYLQDIKEAIILKLKNAFPSYKIYGEKVEQGFIAPAFNVEIIPVQTKNDLNYKVKQVNIKITYLPLAKVCNNTEKNNMVDNLNNLFDLTFKVKDRYFCILGAYQFAPHDYVQYGFTINFNDEIAGQINLTNVENEEVKMNEDVEHGYTQENIKLMEKLEIKDI